MGAREQGLVEDRQHGGKLAHARLDGDHFAYHGRRDADIYVLRPKQAEGTPVAHDRLRG
jgi:hypothetical protein